MFLFLLLVQIIYEQFAGGQLINKGQIPCLRIKWIGF
jgi:hypothetical protein